MSTAWSETKAGMVEKLEKINRSKVGKNVSRADRLVKGVRREAVQLARRSEVVNWEINNSVFNDAKIKRIRDGLHYQKLIRSGYAVRYVCEVLKRRDSLFERSVTESLSHNHVNSHGYVNFRDHDESFDVDDLIARYFDLFGPGDTWDELFEACEANIVKARVDADKFCKVVDYVRKLINLLRSFCNVTDGSYDKLSSFLKLFYDGLIEYIDRCESTEKTVQLIKTCLYYNLSDSSDDMRHGNFKQLTAECEEALINVYFKIMDKLEELFPSLSLLLEHDVFSDYTFMRSFHFLGQYFVYVKGEDWPELESRFMANIKYYKYWFLFSRVTLTPIPDCYLESFISQVKELGPRESRWGSHSVLFDAICEYVEDVVKDRVECIEELFVSVEDEDMFNTYVAKIYELKREGFDVKKT